MTIKNLAEKKYRKREIDLTGPGGNAFVILGLANKWAKQLEDRLMQLYGVTPEDVLTEMQESDYDHLIMVFDKYFGKYVDLYR
jgi:hypothetical protein